MLRGDLAKVCVERSVWGHLMARFVATDLPLAPTLRAEMLAPFLIASPPALGPALIEVSALGLFYKPLLCELFADAQFCLRQTRHRRYTIDRRRPDVSSARNCAAPAEACRIPAPTRAVRTMLVRASRELWIADAYGQP